LGVDYLFVVRHGETEANEAGLDAGPLGFPLDKKGKKAVAHLAKTLSDKKISAVYSSPVYRAVQTAEILAKPHHLKVKTIDELTEAKLKPEFIGRRARLHILTNPEAFEETYKQLEGRALRALALIRKNEKGNVIAVSHGDVLMALLHYVVERKIAKNRHFVIHPDPGSLCVFDLREQRPKIEIVQLSSEAVRRLLSSSALQKSSIWSKSQGINEKN
jgi:broad specificity phosphatase PhoE